MHHDGVFWDHQLHWYGVIIHQSLKCWIFIPNKCGLRQEN
jgi:hypothetical protein